MRLALGLVVLTACSHTDTSWNDIAPGGGGTGAGAHPDAALADGVDAPSTTINGRVCLLLTTPQSLTSCAATGAGGLTVTLDSQTAQTADDGAFTLPRPSNTTGLSYAVTGTALKTSLVPYSSSVTLLPAMRLADYDDMATENSANNPGTSAALEVQIKRAGLIVTGATVTSQPATGGVVFYDDVSSQAWNATATGTFGVAWLSDIAAASAALTITSGSVGTTVSDIPLAANAITFVFAEIP